MENFITCLLFIKWCCYGAYDSMSANFFFSSMNKQSFRLPSGEGWGSCSNETVLQPCSPVLAFSCTMDWLPPRRRPRLAQSSYLHGSFRYHLSLLALFKTVSCDCLVNQSSQLKQTYADGKTTMSVYERKTSIKDFYGNALAVYW